MGTDPVSVNYPDDCAKWTGRNCPEYGKNPHHIPREGPPCLGRKGILGCYHPKESK